MLRYTSLIFFSLFCYMKKLIRPLLILISIFPAFIASSQVDIRDSVISTPIVYAAYGFHGLGGDIAKMYGPSSTIGAGIGYKTKQNIYFGIEYNYLFGGKVKTGDEIIKEILTDDGQIIGQNGENATFQYYERGHMVWAHVGKLFPAFGPNPNSGIFIKLGVGYVMHKMDVVVQDNTAMQLRDDYKRGYDHLTNGIGLNQFIGYQFLGDSRMWNFYAGLDFSQAWTKNRREMNFDTRAKDNTPHFDWFYGFKIGWVIPLYRKASVGYYYN